MTRRVSVPTSLPTPGAVLDTHFLALLLNGFAAKVDMAGCRGGINPGYYEKWCWSYSRGQPLQKLKAQALRQPVG